MTWGFSDLVGARGFEPLTSSVSGKRSPPELSARCDLGLYVPTLCTPVVERIGPRATSEEVVSISVTSGSVSDIEVLVPSWRLSLDLDSSLFHSRIEPPRRVAAEDSTYR